MDKYCGQPDYKSYVQFFGVGRITSLTEQQWLNRKEYGILKRCYPLSREKSYSEDMLFFLAPCLGGSYICLDSKTRIRIDYEQMITTIGYYKWKHLKKIFVEKEEGSPKTLEQIWRAYSLTSNPVTRSVHRQQLINRLRKLRGE
jgi:hypothetical protein